MTEVSSKAVDAICFTMGNKRKQCRQYKQAKRIFRGNQFQDEKTSVDTPTPADHDAHCDDLPSAPMPECLAQNSIEEEGRPKDDNDRNADVKIDRTISGSRIIDLCCLDNLLSEICVCSSCGIGKLS